MISIVHTNDSHTSYAHGPGCVGYAGVVGVVEACRARYGADAVCLVDAGDSLSGGRMGCVEEGALAVSIMNRAGYAAACPGNADFAHGTKRLIELAQMARFPYLCCNLSYSATGELVFPAYSVQEIGGAKIGFVGMTTPSLISTAAPISFVDAAGNVQFDFAQDETGDAFYRRVQQAIDDARADGAQLVVGLAHLGQKGQTPRWQSDILAAHVSGLDVLIDAHSHEVLHQTVAGADGEPVLLVQAGAYQSHVGVIVWNPETGELCHELVAAADAPQSPDMERFMATKIQPKLDALDAQVGMSSCDLIARKEDGVSWLIRTSETNFGDLVADAYRWIAKTDVAYLPGWSIRCNLQAGPLTLGQLSDAIPVKMEVVRATLTGRELADLLEFAVRSYPQNNAVFPQVSGMSFTVDASVPTAAILDENECFCRVEGVRRVRDISVAGEPLEWSREYTVAGVDLILLFGGNGFTQFQGESRVEHTGIANVDALRRYIEEGLHGVVGCEYGNPTGQGRCTIVD